jgi:hypothetical protein
MKYLVGVNKSLSLFLFFIITGCGTFLPLYTPNGVNLEPIISLQIHSEFKGVVSLKIPYGNVMKKDGEITLGFRPLHPEPSYIEITQFESETKAAERYLAKRKMILNESASKLYSESGLSSNSHFIIYKGSQWNSNHGIPAGKYSQPEITIGVLKKNLFIYIRYTGYENDVDYIKWINQDITFTGKLLKSAISSD